MTVAHSVSLERLRCDGTVEPEIFACRKMTPLADEEA